MAAAPPEPAGAAELAGVPVLARGPDWLAVAKPAGLAVHRGWAPERDTLVDRLRDALRARVHPVHRLDRGTSGVVLLATTAAAASALQRALADPRARKRYWALVRGGAVPEQLLDHPVPRDGDGERVPARTYLRTLAVAAPPAAPRVAWIEAWPLTGRTHQIRRHLKHLARPLVGDVRYGKGPINRHFRAVWQLERLALHAAELTWPAPGQDGAIERVTAPVPADLARVVEGLGLVVPAAVGEWPWAPPPAGLEACLIAAAADPAPAADDDPDA